MSTLHFTSVMWAYLQAMPMDLKSGKRGLPGRKSTYGNISSAALDYDTGGYGNKRDDEDYYIGLSESFGYRPTGSRDIDYGAFYPERLFVWGFDDEGADLNRGVLLQKLQDLGIRQARPEYWWPCHPWRGYSHGKPTFYNALRAHTDIGMRYYNLVDALRDKVSARTLDVEMDGHKATLYEV